MCHGGGAAGTFGSGSPRSEFWPASYLTFPSDRCEHLSGAFLAMLSDAARSVVAMLYAIRCASHYHITDWSAMLAERDQPLVNVF
jgi:hypothetical protein